MNKSNAVDLPPVLPRWLRDRWRQCENFSLLHFRSTTQRRRHGSMVNTPMYAITVILSCTRLFGEMIWPLAVKCSKFCSVSFYRDTDFSWVSSCRYCADCATNLPGTASDNILSVLQISSKSVHYRWILYSRICVNTAKMRRKLNPIFDWNL